MPVGRVEVPQSLPPPPASDWRSSSELTNPSPSEEIPACQLERARMKSARVFQAGVRMQKVVYGATAVVLVLWAGWFLAVLHWSPSEPYALATNGVLGDSFGVLNSLFSALALVGVIATLFTQLTQIRDQAADQGFQNFERQNSAFVDRILLVRDRAYVMTDVHRTKEAITGLQAFKWMGDVAEREIINKRSESGTFTSEFLIGLYNQTIKGVSYTSIKPFIFYIKEAINHIHSSSIIPDSKKAWYANLIFGLLSDEEIFVIATSIIRYGDWYMKERIEEYGLLSNFDNSQFILFFRSFYSSSAFDEMGERLVS
jgi:flagellar biogenesis protein FliO